jgi:hypothetical protein
MLYQLLLATQGWPELQVQARVPGAMARMEEATMVEIFMMMIYTVG